MLKITSQFDGILTRLESDTVKIQINGYISNKKPDDLNSLIAYSHVLPDLYSRAASNFTHRHKQSLTRILIFSFSSCAFLVFDCYNSARLLLFFQSAAKPTWHDLLHISRYLVVENVPRSI